MANKNNEIGKIGQKRYNGIFYEEFVRELAGVRGIEAYKEMSNNDSTIGAILFAIENLIRQCDFTVSPGGTTQKDKEAAEFVEQCMNDMQDTWSDTISEIISFLTYGWSYHEIVYKIRAGRKKDSGLSSKYDDGLIGWKKLPIRSQDTFYEWKYDENTDELLGMVQCPPPNYPMLFIPIEKALHFKTRSNKGNPEGRSVLRTCYRDWYFKKRIQEIEGIGIERDLAGLPVLTPPEGVDIWDQSDPDMLQTHARALSIVTGIRRDEREGLVKPNGWTLELLSTGSRRQFDTNQIIERYDKRMATTVLADFIFLGQQAVGSFALSDNKTKLFSLAIGTFLDIICEVFNNQAIPRLIDMNSEHFKGITEYPKMVHSDIETPDLAQISSFLKEMIGVGVIVPDDELEDFVRRSASLPDKVGETESSSNRNTGSSKDEQQTVYKITSLIDKYRNGSISRDTAKELMLKIGTDPESVERYLSDADDLKASQEEKDKKDAAEAEKAKNKLGRNSDLEKSLFNRLMGL